MELLLRCGAAVDFTSPQILTFIKPDGTLSQGVRRFGVPFAIPFGVPFGAPQDVIHGAHSSYTRSVNQFAWRLPIAASMSRGHQDIVDLLSSSIPLLLESISFTTTSQHSATGSNEQSSIFPGQSVGSQILPQSEQNQVQADLVERTILAKAAILPLRQAAEIEILVYAGALRECIRIDDKSCLLWALELERDQYDLVDFRLGIDLSDFNHPFSNFLLRSSPDPQYLLHTTLIEAATLESYQAIQLLLGKGAQLYTSGPAGGRAWSSVLDYEARKGNIDLQRAFKVAGIRFALLSKGLDVDCGGLLRTIKTTITAFKPNGCLVEDYYSVLRSAVKTPPLLSELFNIWAFPSNQDVPINAALFAVVKHGRYDLVNQLCAMGANVNVKRDGGQSPLMYASWLNDSPTLIQLLCQGADPHAEDDAGLTALLNAVVNSQSDVVEILAQRLSLAQVHAKLALGVCIVSGNARVWKILTRTELHEELSLVCVETGNTEMWKAVTKTELDAHPSLPSICMPSYSQSRAEHLQSCLCIVVPGVFELPDTGNYSLRKAQLSEDGELLGFEIFHELPAGGADPIYSSLVLAETRVVGGWTKVNKPKPGWRKLKDM